MPSSTLGADATQPISSSKHWPDMGWDLGSLHSGCVLPGWRSSIVHQCTGGCALRQGFIASNPPHWLVVIPDKPHLILLSSIDPLEVHIVAMAGSATMHQDSSQLVQGTARPVIIHGS